MNFQAIDIAYFVVGDVVHSVGVIDIFIRIQRRSVDHAYGEKKRETHELHFVTNRLRFDLKIALLALEEQRKIYTTNGLYPTSA